MNFFRKKAKVVEPVVNIDSELYVQPDDVRTVGFVYSIASTQFSVALLKIRMENMDGDTLLRANKTIRCLQLGIAYDS